MPLNGFAGGIDTASTERCDILYCTVFQNASRDTPYLSKIYQVQDTFRNRINNSRSQIY